MLSIFESEFLGRLLTLLFASRAGKRVVEHSAVWEKLLRVAGVAYFFKVLFGCRRLSSAACLFPFAPSALFISIGPGTVPVSCVIKIPLGLVYLFRRSP